MTRLIQSEQRRQLRSTRLARRTERRLLSKLDEVHAQAGFTASWQEEPVCMLLVAVVCLALLNFFSTTPVLAWLLAKDEAMVPSEWRSAYWVGCRVLCYFLLPAIAAAALGRSPRDCGLRFRGVSRHLPAYLSLGGLMLPIVVSVSYLPAFQRYYPFYDHAEQSVQGLLLWEALYAVQFITLEYFYRGFLLFSLERFLGVYAVFVMVIPYCMMHFGKPFVETLAAIPAGIVLGILALKTRSVWPGAALHIAVGWTTDLLSLWQRGLLWELWSGD